MLKTVLLVLLYASILGAASVKAQEGSAPSQKCAIGPQERMYGQTKWLLYGCDGGSAAAIVPAKGNPAAPFFFLLFRDGGGIKIYGEGVGDKNASDAAMKELKNLAGAALEKVLLDAQSPKR